MLYGEQAKCQAEAEYPELWRGLVGAWSPCLSPRGGTVLRDLSGRQNHGTLTNMDPATDWVVSGGKPAIDLDGTNDYVTIGDVASTKITTGQLTLRYWFARRASGVHNVVSKWSSTGSQRSYVLDTFSDNVTYWELSPNGTTNVFFTPSIGEPARSVTDTSWHQVVGVWVASTVQKLYYDGREVSGTVTGTIPASLYDSTAAFNIGTSVAGGTWYANGLIDDVGLYDVAWSAKQVAMDFCLGRGGWAARRRRRRYASAVAAAIPYWAFSRQRSQIIGGGVS